MDKLNILAITDLHYIGMAQHSSPHQERKCGRALQYLREIACRTNMNEIDLVVLLGDLTDNGNAVGADKDLKDVKDLVYSWGKPVIAICGNHDGDQKTFLDVFAHQERMLQCKGYQIIAFHDSYDERNVCRRDWKQMDKLFARRADSGQVIVLQHNPIYPKIKNVYPYNLTDMEQLCRYYSEKGVLLSISGHAHWGIPPIMRDGVEYITLPALCEEPHGYGIITVQDSKVNYLPCSLKDAAS